jgi:hypothetical protein
MYVIFGCCYQWSSGTQGSDQFRRAKLKSSAIVDPEKLDGRALPAHELVGLQEAIECPGILHLE